MLFPYLIFWRAAEAIGLSTIVIQRLWLVGLFVLAAVSAWTLIRVLVPDRPPWFAVAGVVVYLFNPFTLTDWAIGHQVAFLAYAVAPLWLAVFLRTVQRPASVWSGLPLGATSLLFAGSFNNPAIVLTMIVLPTLAVAVVLITRRGLPVGAMIGRTAAVIPWFLLLHAWWLLPLARGLTLGPYEYAGRSWRLFDYPALVTPVGFLDFVRGTGYWGFHSGYLGEPYFSWAHSLQHPLVVIATLWLVASVWLPLAGRRSRRWAFMAIGLYLIAVFFSKGVNPPFGEMNRWFYLNIPGFYLFRGTVEKFGGLAFLGLLISLAVTLGDQSITAIRRYLLAGISVVAALISAWPLVSGDVIQSQNPNGVRSSIRIPAYYEDFQDWTRERRGSGSLLIVPQTPTGYIKTTWGFAGADPIHHFSVLPTIMGTPEARPQDGPVFEASLRAATAFDEPRLLQRLGIRWVVVRHDIDPAYYPGTPDPRYVEGRLHRAGFVHVGSMGPLHVFSVPGDGVVRAAGYALAPTDPSAGMSERLMVETSSPVLPAGAAGEGSVLACIPDPVSGRGTSAERCGLAAGPVDRQLLFRRFDLRVESDLNTRVGLRLPQSTSGLGEDGVWAEVPIDVPSEAEALRVDNQLIPLEGSGGFPASVSLYENSVLEALEPVGPNLVPSVENGAWGGPQPLRAHSREFDAIPSGESEQAQPSLELDPGTAGTYVSTTLSGVGPQDALHVSFDYRTAAGGVAGFGVWEHGSSRYAVEALRLSPAAGWTHWEGVGALGPGPRTVEVFLYARPGSGRAGSVRFDAVEVRKLVPGDAVPLSKFLQAEDQFGFGTYSAGVGNEGPLRDLIEDGSFEESVWSGPIYVGGDPPQGLAARPTRDSIAGSRALELQSSGGGVAVSREIAPFDSEALYRIRFHYRHVRGAPPAFGVWDSGAGSYAARDFSLRTDPGWHEKEILVQPGPQSSGLQLFLYAFADSGVPTMNRYDDVEVSAIPVTERTLVTDATAKRPSAPRVEVVEAKANSVSGTLRGVEGQAWLLFAQAFHPAWTVELFSDEGGDAPAVDRHVRADGFANAWLIKGNGDIHFRIAYAGRSWPFVGLVIALVTLVAGFVGWRRSVSARRR